MTDPITEIRRLCTEGTEGHGDEFYGPILDELQKIRASPIMRIQTGKPGCDGRYIIFIPIENSEYCEPVIGDYQRGNFLWRQNVLGWIGPLPEPVLQSVLRAAAPAKASATEVYDL